MNADDVLVLERLRRATEEVRIATALNESIKRQYAEEMVRPVIERAEGASFYVRSRTNPEVEYRVDQAIDGSLLCSCPAATHERHCWHVAYLKEEEMVTETSTALVPVKIQPPKSLVPSEREYALIDRAAALALAGAITLPRELNTPEKVASVMLYGRELGLAPMTSIRHIYIVNGRPQPSAEVMAGLAVSRESDIRLIPTVSTAETCTIRFVRPSHGINVEFTVTKDDAVKAGLWGKGTWAAYPRDMLRWHCTKRVLRIWAPDLINGIEAFGETVSETVVEDDPTIIEGELYNPGDEPEAVSAPPRPSPPSQGRTQAPQKPVAAPDHEAAQETPATARSGQASDRPLRPSPASSPARQAAMPTGCDHPNPEWTETGEFVCKACRVLLDPPGR